MVESPRLPDDLSLDAVAEPLHVQALVAELSVETLVGAVLPGFSARDVRRLDTFLGDPLQDDCGHELWTIVVTRPPNRSAESATC